MGFSPSVVRLIGSPHTDGEYIVLRGMGVDEETVRLHDYPRLYAVPGLYEHVVQELLGCRSPQVAADGLAHALERLGLDPADVPLLDLGAGTGLVGELVRGLGATTVIGLDALDAARERMPARPAGCLPRLPRWRSRPSAARAARASARIPSRGPRLRRCPRRNPCPGGGARQRAGTASGWRSRRLHDRRTLDADRWSRWISHAHRPAAGLPPVAARERSRFQHRRSTGGTPIHYEMFIAAKGCAPAS